MNLGDRLALEALRDGDDIKLYNIPQLMQIILDEIDRLEKENIRLEQNLLEAEMQLRSMESDHPYWD